MAQPPVRPILSIDFDGTLVEHAFPDIGKPIPEAIQTVQYLNSIGCHCILWTCRTGVELAQAIIWVHNSDLEFRAFNCNMPGSSFNPIPKIYADLYIDDRNVGLYGKKPHVMWAMVVDAVHNWIKSKTGEDLSK